MIISLQGRFKRRLRIWKIFNKLFTESNNLNLLFGEDNNIMDRHI